MKVLLRRLSVIAFATFSVLAALAFAAPEARAENIARHPGDHYKYSAELEPHLNINWFSPGYDYRGRYGGLDLGPGFRATIPIMDPGFVRSINDSVGITFGLDLGFCSDYYYCPRRVVFHSPVGVQWNFFITPRFNVFAEGGAMIEFAAVRDYGYARSVDFNVFFMGGLRYLFNDKVGLTVRLGYPFFSVGLSIFV